MLFQDLIAQKRDGATLNNAQISQVVRYITSGDGSDAQLGALAMAILLKGMSLDETVALTLAMRDSGAVLNWDLPGPVVDKHSTGGVGDNVSLVLAPALAACDVFVPMISGRGLGHTGGTLDKFDAIPGYQTQPDLDLFLKITRDVGCAVIGQTSDVAPADKRLYGIRDVTATVESPELICASILSKKLAAGLDTLVLDIKFGTGAFMAASDDADALAGLLVKVANGAGCKTSALLTDMNEPLASAAGNALEMSNAIAFLRGDEVDSRLWDVTVALGSELLLNCGRVGNLPAAQELFTNALTSGAAAEKFAQMVTGLGGPSDLMDAPARHLAAAPIIADVYAEGEGFVSAIDTRALGQAVVEMGGGRRVATDPIDYTVGLDHIAGIGALVDAETPIARVHVNTATQADSAIAAVRQAYTISPDVTDPGPLIARRVE